MKNSPSTLITVATRIVISIGVVALSLFIFLMLKNSKPQPALSSLAGDVPRVMVIEAAAVPIHRRSEGFGTARAMDTADVPARVSATVREIPQDIEPGLSVSKGQVLVRLDESDFMRRVEIARETIADLDAQLGQVDIEEKSARERLKLIQEQVSLARGEHERVRMAAERGAAKPREVDQARQSLLVVIQNEVLARETLDRFAPRRLSLMALRNGQESTQQLAQQNLERCVIRSPIEGVIESVDVEMGENVRAGSRVVRVVSISRIETPVYFPASSRADIQVGDRVDLFDTGRRGTRWQAEVTRIGPTNDEATRTFAVYVEMEQDAARAGQAMLAPGAFIRGVAMARESRMSWVVPRRALNSERIFLIRNKIIITRPIEIDSLIEGEFVQFGVPDDQWVVLRDPLEPGDLVVVTGARSLKEGSAAEPVIPSIAGRGKENSAGGAR